MATWTSSTTSTDEAAPGPLQVARDKILGFCLWLLKIMVVAILLLAEFCSVADFQDTHANPTDIRQEIDGLIQSGSSKELELDLEKDMELYNTMMTLVTNMKYGNFELEGSKAQEFWAAYAPGKSDTELKYVRFNSEDRHVLLRYSNGIAAEVTMEFDPNYLYKATTLNYGIFNGSLPRWIGWKIAGRFIKGYPCYVTEASLNGNGIRGDTSLRKYTLRNHFFSWTFHPGRYYHPENITGHWL